MRTTKRKLSELSVGNNVIIPIPQYDRGPTDPRNILGVIEEVSEYGYRVGKLLGYLCRTSRKDICRDGIIEMLRLVSFTASIWFLQRYPNNFPTR
jgi:hypothetical protein